jgi:nitrogen fixation NifU-like protein
MDAGSASFALNATVPLGDMHQEVIIDHGRHPYNLRKLEDATRTALGVNPLCANQLTGHLELTDGRINGIGFQGSGGAISQTCASLLSTVRTGKSGEVALALFGDVRAVLTEESDGEVDLARLGSLAALPPPISDFPMWVKYATLAGTHLGAPSTTTTPRGLGSSRG